MCLLICNWQTFIWRVWGGENSQGTCCSCFLPQSDSRVSLAFLSLILWCPLELLFFNPVGSERPWCTQGNTEHSSKALCEQWYLTLFCSFLPSLAHNHPLSAQASSQPFLWFFKPVLFHLLLKYPQGWKKRKPTARFQLHISTDCTPFYFWAFYPPPLPQLQRNVHIVQLPLQAISLYHCIFLC